MSYEQMSHFWRLKDCNDEHLVNNYRPVQERNDRVVLHADLHLHCDSNAHEWHTVDRCQVDWRYLKMLLSSHMSCSPKGFSQKI